MLFIDVRCDKRDEWVTRSMHTLRRIYLTALAYIQASCTHTTDRKTYARHADPSPSCIRVGDEIGEVPAPSPSPLSPLAHMLLSYLELRQTAR